MIECSFAPLFSIEETVGPDIMTYEGGQEGRNDRQQLFSRM